MANNKKKDVSETKSGSIESGKDFIINELEDAVSKDKAHARHFVFEVLEPAIENDAEQGKDLSDNALSEILDVCGFEVGMSIIKHPNSSAETISSALFEMSSDDADTSEQMGYVAGFISELKLELSKLRKQINEKQPIDQLQRT